MLTDHTSYSGIHHFTVATLEAPEFPPHIHLSFELISVLEGSIDLLINGRAERLSAGQSALIFPHQIHSVQSENARLRHCTFSPFLAISYYTYHKNLHPDSNRFELPSLLMQIFLQLKQEDHYYAHKGFLYQMLVAFEQGRTYSPADTSSKSLTVKMLTFIEANYMEECTLEK